jgi:chromosome segregation ATPase
MPGKPVTPLMGNNKEIDSILNGDVKSYARWAYMRIGGLERNREYLKKQAKLAEQRCAATERIHTMAMESEAAQRERAENAEKRLAQAEERLAEMAAKHQKQSGTNRPLEKAIMKLASSKPYGC